MLIQNEQAQGCRVPVFDASNIPGWEQHPPGTFGNWSGWSNVEAEGVHS
jgi:hypothetical protein